MLIEVAKYQEMSFEKLASYLIRKLGKKKARKLVEKEAIMEYYGKDVIPIWETLLKE